MSNQKPIADNLFTWPSDQPKLLGSKDTETGRYFFPAKKSNTHEQVELSTKGKLWTWTVQRFMPKTPYIGTEKPEDFKPYAVGYIELPGEIMVESRLEGVNPEDLEIGMEMELSIDPFVKNEDGEELMMFSFRPCKN
tara:strand:+ start:452 stop:862 length:411 start_codon:yes stop_codon:yes gene_type:complete